MMDLVKLLRSNLHRYFCSRSFLIFSLFSVAVGAWLGIMIYRESMFGTAETWLVILQWALLSVFTTLTVGKEHAHGGFRRKCVPGHSKGKIFIAELLIAFFVSTLLFLMCGLPVVLINVQIIPNFTAKILFYFIIGVWLGNLLVVAISLTLAMLVPHGTAASAVSLLLILCMLLWADTVSVRLEQSEYQNTIRYDPITDSFVKQQEKNPKYIYPPMRDVLKTVDSALPITQLSFCASTLRSCFLSDEAWAQKWEGLPSDAPQRPDTVADEDYQTMTAFPLYSLAWIVLIVAIGFLLFRRKSLK